LVGTEEPLILDDDSEYQTVLCRGNRPRSDFLLVSFSDIFWPTFWATEKLGRPGLSIGLLVAPPGSAEAQLLDVDAQAPSELRLVAGCGRDDSSPTD
jgi:hypothetical protein